MGAHCEGVKGATADFVCFHCPLVAPAAAKSPACEKDKLCLEDRQSGRAHLARHSIDVGKSSLGGAPAGAQSYWQGRFAACAFVDFSFGVVNRGTVGALPQTPPEAPPLDSARGIAP